MKKAAKILGIVALVLSIVSTVLISLALIISGIVSLVSAIAALAQGGAEAVGGLVAAIFMVVFGLIFIAVGIASIVVSNRFNKALAVAKDKTEMKKIAIAEIVFGALTNEVGIVAGIFALVMNPEQYAVVDNIKAPDIDLEKHLKKAEEAGKKVIKKDKDNKEETK